MTNVHEITVPKAWGHEVWLVNTELSCLKELHITPGWQCSLHRHRIKDETFIVQSGHVEIELGGRYWQANPGETIHVPPLTWHRFASHTGAMLLEVSTHHSDADVERREESQRCCRAASGELVSVDAGQAE